MSYKEFCIRWDIGPDQYCYTVKQVKLHTLDPQSERNRERKKGEKRYITTVISKTEARFRVGKNLPQ